MSSPLRIAHCASRGGGSSGSRAELKGPELNNQLCEDNESKTADSGLRRRLFGRRGSGYHVQRTVAKVTTTISETQCFPTFRTEVVATGDPL